MLYILHPVKGWSIYDAQEEGEGGWEKQAKIMDR